MIRNDNERYKTAYMRKSAPYCKKCKEWRIFEAFPVNTLFYVSYHTLFSDNCHY